MIGEAIYKLLTDSPEFMAIAAKRVYPLRITQTDPMPAVTYQTISNGPVYCKEGDGGAERKRMQINIYSRIYSEQEVLAEIIRTILHGYSGAVGGEEIEDIQYQTERDLHDDNTVDPVYFKAQDYIITIKR